MRTEDQEQEIVISWAEYSVRLHPELRMLYHVPNGGSRHVAEAAKFKRMGVKKGVPDLVLPVARKGCHGLYIELKRERGGVLSENQKQWLSDLKDEGYLAICCHGAKEAIEAIKKYLEEA